MSANANGTPTSLGIPTLNPAQDDAGPLGINEITQSIDAKIAARMFAPSAPTDKQVVKWSQSGGAWVAGFVAPSELAQEGATDGQIMSWSQSSGKWVPANGGLKLIQEITGTGASGTISFTTGLTGYRSLFAQWRVRSDTAAASTLIRFKANNVAGATDYLSRSSDGWSDYNTSGYLGTVSAASLSGGAKLGGGYVYVHGCADASANARKWWNGGYEAKIAATGTASSDLAIGTLMGEFWESTAQAAITRLDFILGAGNFTTDSVIALYGII